MNDAKAQKIVFNLNDLSCKIENPDKDINQAWKHEDDSMTTIENMCLCVVITLSNMIKKV